ncbi:hypothetical protein L9F63_023119, partial [Diploptera punctata]
EKHRVPKFFAYQPNIDLVFLIWYRYLSLPYKFLLIQDTMYQFPNKRFEFLKIRFPLMIM